MRRVTVSQLLFIIYCVEAGVLLVLLPWTSGWQHALLRLPGAQWEALATHPWIRGLVTGFGLVHIVWGAHDLDLLLSRRRRT
ncbi:MAG: hypothetical protein R2991_14325 [Thermoanaerobaculia bacterium]